MADETEAPPNLDDVTSDELIAEVMRRFQSGIMFVRKASGVPNGESLNMAWFTWGDPIWCQGACSFLGIQAAQRTMGG